MEALITTFGVDWRSLALEVVNFGILVALLTWLLYKPVLKMVKDRQQIVEKGVEDAEKAVIALSEADQEAKKRLKGAEGEAEGIVKAARSEASEEQTKILRAAEARAAQVEKDAEARAQEASEKARRDSEKDIARVALLAAEKILYKS